MRKILTAAALTAGLAVSMTAQSARVYKVGEDGVKAPVLVKEVKPQYTEGAKARHVQGVVELAAVVKTNGAIDEQAIVAARQWKFRPGTKDGEPVNVEVHIELTFTLR